MKNKKLQVFKFVLFFSFFIFGANVTNAATLYLSPSSGNYSVGNILTANVLINTEGVPVNNAEAVINFPNNLLEIVSISKSNSVFSLWVEDPTFSNSAGTLTFNGGMPTPGFSGSSGKIISIVFRAKKTGLASVIFSSEAVRANDGLGTNVFKNSSNAQYNLISTEKIIKPTVPVIDKVPLPKKLTPLPLPVVETVAPTVVPVVAPVVAQVEEPSISSAVSCTEKLLIVVVPLIIIIIILIILILYYRYKFLSLRKRIHKEALQQAFQDVKRRSGRIR